MGATMGYAIVAELAHELETVLDRVRRNDLAIDADIMDVLFRAADVLEHAVEAAVAGRDGEVVADGSRGARCTRSASASDADKRRMDGRRRRAARARSCAFASRRTRRCAACARSSSCRRSRKIGEVVVVEPSLEDLQADGFDDDFAVRARHDRRLVAEIERVVRAAGDVVDVQVGDDASRIRRCAATSQFMIPCAMPVERAAAPRRVADRLGADQAAGDARSVRIDVRRLDTLMNLSASW